MSLKIKNGVVLINYALISALILTGCSAADVKSMVNQGGAIPTTQTRLAATNLDKVKIYYSNLGLPKHYKVIGRVSASNDNIVGIPHSQESIAEMLKKQAASIGATGVINLSDGFEKTTGDAIVTK